MCCRAYGEGEHTSLEIKQLIDHHLQAKADIESALPQHLVIGPFYINVDSVRMAIANKHRDMAKSLLDFLATKLRKDADKVRHRYAITCMCDYVAVDL